MNETMDVMCEAARVVQLVGMIDDEIAQQVIHGLYKLSATDRDAPITLLIASGGGGVYPANAIIDTIVDIQARGTRVKGRVHGHAMSAAVFPLLVCDERVAGQHSMFMIHGMTDTQIAADIRNIEAEQRANRALIEMYANALGARTRHNARYWLPKLKDRVPMYYTAQEAVDIGLVDAIADGVR